MRCGCGECGAFMVHAEGADYCVCPDCGNQCSACLGTNTVVKREDLAKLAKLQWIQEDIEREEENGAS